MVHTSRYFMHAQSYHTHAHTACMQSALVHDCVHDHACKALHVHCTQWHIRAHTLGSLESMCIIYTHSHRHTLAVHAKFVEGIIIIIYNKNVFYSYIITCFNKVTRCVGGIRDMIQYLHLRIWICCRMVVVQWKMFLHRKTLLSRQSLYYTINLEYHGYIMVQIWICSSLAVVQRNCVFTSKKTVLSQLYYEITMRTTVLNINHETITVQILIRSSLAVVQWKLCFYTEKHGFITIIPRNYHEYMVISRNYHEYMVLSRNYHGINLDS